jgi:transposase
VLRQVSVDEQAVALRLLVDRRDDLGVARAQTVNRLHRLLAELVPGGAKTALTARAARALLATVRPRDVAGKTRRRLAADLISEVEAVDKKITAATKQLSNLITAIGSTVQQLHGIGPSGAARLLGDIGDITRFPTRGHFASWNGTAPIDASSGDHTRHRLSRAGNRRINKVLHIMAVVQLRHDTLGRAYYRRKIAAGKTPNEAMRALKRRLSDLVYRQLRADHQRQHPAAHAQKGAPAAAAAPPTARQAAAGSRGHLGATTQSSATGSHPTTGTSDKSLPEPAKTHATPRARAHATPRLEHHIT